MCGSNPVIFRFYLDYSSVAEGAGTRVNKIRADSVNQGSVEHTVRQSTETWTGGV